MGWNPQTARNTAFEGPVDRNVRFWYLLPVSNETKPFPESQPGKHRKPFAAVDCRVLFRNCSGLLRVGRASPAQPSLICRVSLSAAHLEEQQYLAGRGGLSCHCNKDSFVNVRRLGTEGFWEEAASPPAALPPLRGGGVLFLSLASPRLLFMLSLDLLLVPLFLHVVPVSFCVTGSLFSRPYCE